MSPDDQAVHAARRQAYMDAIGPRAVALVHSPPEATRNGDVLHPFRQSSDLHYLTGFTEPETTLVLRPGDQGQPVVMFVRPRDPERETWDGRRAGVAGAREVYGADRAYPIDQLEDRLPELLANVDEVYYSLGLDRDFDQLFTGMLADLRTAERRGKHSPRAVVDPRSVLHEMRLHKDDAELGLMRKAADITAKAHIAAMQAATPDVTEYQLEALINYEFRRQGGTGPGYGTIVGAGANATILHYTENNCALTDGDLVLIDAGCEYSGYTADITRTFPVSGRFSEAQRRMYEVVLDAQTSAVAMTRPGITIDDIHDHCVRRLTEGMLELGLLSGTVEANIADDSYKRYYLHRTSHWLGLDVHDVGAYTRDGKPRPLRPGMVITIEPGLYVADDDTDAPEQFRGIGIRIEDDILVTEDGHENLTAAAPKTIADVEAACAAGAQPG